MLTNILKLLFYIFLVFYSVSIQAATTIETFVSILPQKYFVERIGGERVNVHVMVKPGQSPETFEPSSKLMSLYSKADAYFTIGMPFEQVWIRRVASLNNNISIVNTQEHTGSEQHLLPGQHNHKHNPNEHETSNKWDPHTWLSPVLAIQQAKLIMRELTRLSPKDKVYLYNNYKKLEFELNVLHKELSELFKHTDKQHFVTFHPAFSYFSHEYGLTQIAIEIDGKEPSAKQIAQVVNRIQDKQVKYILIEKQFNRVIPRTIARSVGAQLLILDPLAWDYLHNMRDIADKINRALF